MICFGLGESLYNEDGSVVAHKLRILSRTYPQAVAGTITSYHFDPITGAFTMNWGLLSDVPDATGQSATTEIYFNRELYYPHGAHVTITDDATGTANTQTQLHCTHASNIASVIQTTGAVQGNNVTVRIIPCLPLSEDCSCR
jgi:hypothetical protein